MWVIGQSLNTRYFLCNFAPHLDKIVITFNSTHTTTVKHWKRTSQSTNWNPWEVTRATPPIAKVIRFTEPLVIVRLFLLFMKGCIEVMTITIDESWKFIWRVYWSTVRFELMVRPPPPPHFSLSHTSHFRVLCLRGGGDRFRVNLRFSNMCKTSFLRKRTKVIL